jgi:hypothetical protein
MARTKQTARRSTGGKRPTRADLASRLAAASATAITTEKWKNRCVTHIWASTKDEFGGYVDRGGTHAYIVPADELHPLVRGFLKLLGVKVIVPLVDLAVLIGGDCSPHGGPDTAEGDIIGTGPRSVDDVLFERMRLIFDPDLGKEDHERWRVMASRRGKGDWHVVSALTYNAYVGTTRISFESYACMDPNDWDRWESTAKTDAAMIWDGYKQCKGRVLAEIEGGIRKASATVTFRHGSRGPSETTILQEGLRVKIPYARCQDSDLSCVPASLANVLAEQDPVFSEELVNGSRLEMFENLRQFAGWLLTAKCFSRKRIQYELRNCLPNGLRSQSLRDPVNKSSEDLSLRARQRLEWILGQKDGEFIVTVIASDGHSAHVVGVSARRHIIFDHEDPKSLPFNSSGFDAACSGTGTCVGLGEVKLVGSKTRKRNRNS